MKLTRILSAGVIGLAIGVAFGSGEIGLGLIMAVAISIHNIPEGLAVSLPLRAEGVSGWRCVGWAIVSGIPQLLACVPAYLAVVAFRPILPYAFGVAAGAGAGAGAGLGARRLSRLAGLDAARRASPSAIMPLSKT